MTWVKGHYEGPENHFKYSLNKIAHQLAVDFLKHPHPNFTSVSLPVPPPSHHILVFHEKEILTSGLNNIINHAYYFPPLHKKIL
jgi:hypothetical protein